MLSLIRWNPYEEMRFNTFISLATDMYTLENNNNYYNMCVLHSSINIVGQKTIGLRN